MKVLEELIGSGNDISTLQMVVRATLVFFLIALVYLQIVDRRSFGVQTPFNNVTSFLIGAILSRGREVVAFFIYLCRSSCFSGAA